MTRLRNVGGKITETTGGNETLHAGKDIVYNATKAINFKGNDGIKFGQPGKLTDLKVTKVEGPFDDKGKLVQEIKMGTGYTYKATPNRTPTAGEVVLLKWAVKKDEGEIAEVSGASPKNHLAEGKIVISITANGECKKARIYAYFNKADEGASVSASSKNKFPILVLQGSRRKGQNRQNNGPALDMLSKDYTDDAAGYEKLRKELYNENYNVNNKDGFFSTRAENAKSASDFTIEKVKEFCKKSDTELFEIFREDIKGYAMGDIETVAVAMVDKMKSNSGGEYKNDTLTTAVINHANSKTFIKAIKKVIAEHVKETKGVVTDLEITDDGKGKLYDKLVRDKVDNPKFSDWFSGLGITINDVWAYQIFITDFKVNGNNFDMKLEYVYYDHFGLDYPDIQKYNKDIFYSWFVLQHFKGYKPFITKLEITGPLQGTF